MSLVGVLSVQAEPVPWFAWGDVHRSKCIRRLEGAWCDSVGGEDSGDFVLPAYRNRLGRRFDVSFGRVEARRNNLCRDAPGRLHPSTLEAEGSMYPRPQVSQVTRQSHQNCN